MKKPKTYLVDELGRHYELIKGYIPDNYSIWNANLLIINNRYYLKLYATNEVNDYTVNIKSLKCLRVNKKDALKINDCISGGRNPSELYKALSSEDHYIRNKASEIRPYIIKLFNVKWPAPALHTKAELARNGLNFKDFEFVYNRCNNGEYLEILIKVFSESSINKVREVCKILNSDFINSKVFVEPAICY